MKKLNIPALKWKIKVYKRRILLKVFKVLDALQLVEHFDYQDTISVLKHTEVKTKGTNLPFIRANYFLTVTEFREIYREFYYSPKTKRRLWTVIDDENIYNIFSLQACNPRDEYGNQYIDDKTYIKYEGENMKPTYYKFNWQLWNTFDKKCSVEGRYEEIPYLKKKARVNEMIVDLENSANKKIKDKYDYFIKIKN